jgi:hypothetical protein
MSLSEESGLYSLEQGCPLHGDEYLRECSMCGCEFCRTCHRGAVCPDCAAEADNDDLDDEESAPDFEDVSSVKDLLGDDEEAEKVLQDDEDLIPPEDLVDDEEEKA